jgi:glycosyltransferase involved in cell wall biosynthesis
MARVLILGLYYPPANFMAGRRFEGWSRHLPSFGHEPLVLTRFYDPEERNSRDFYASSRSTRTLTERWVESDGVVYTNFIQSRWGRLPLSGKVRGLGHFLWPDPDHSGWLRQCLMYLESATFKPDLIIASSSPPGVFRVARKLSARLRVPWIADFRDLWINDSDGSVSTRLKLSLQRGHLSSASGITVVTDGMAESIRKQLGPSHQPIRAIFNGAEPLEHLCPDPNDQEVVAAFQSIQASYPIVLTYTGTLYPQQHIERYLNTIAELNKSGEELAAVVLCGKHDAGDYEQWPFVHLLRPIAHQTALFLQSESSALFYPTWPRGYSIFSGKIFELMVSGRPVLVGFTPSPDLEALCQHSATVSMMKSPDELIRVLQELPRIGENSVFDIPAIATKKYWAGELARFVDEILNQAGSS